MLRVTLGSRQGGFTHRHSYVGKKRKESKGGLIFLSQARSLNAAGMIIWHECQKGLCIHVTNAWLGFEISSNSFINESIFSQAIEPVLEDKL